MSLRGAVALLIATAFAGGSASAEEPRAPASPEEIVAYRDSGEWAQDTTAAVDRARSLLDAELRRAVENPALVLDIDDTSLSNYDCMRARGFRRDPECAAGARLPAIPQTLELFRHARSRDVSVFFISGRRERQRAATTRNLRRAGYTGYEKLILRPNREKRGTHDGWKARMRRRIVRDGFSILVNAGDQRSDLDGGSATHAIKLPNPMYVIKDA
jgi:predicted secreted acid phosphatase